MALFTSQGPTASFEKSDAVNIIDTSKEDLATMAANN